MISSRTEENIRETVTNNYEDMLHKMFEEYHCLFDGISEELQEEIDNELEQVVKLTVRVVDAKRRQLTLSEVASVLYNYVTVDVESGTLSEDAIAILIDSGFTYDDICDVGLGWLFGED